MSKGIKTLKLCGFRGASTKCELTFDQSKALVMIFGENGTGKSSLADAIDFVANGSVGSLEDRSVGSAKLPFLHSIDKTPADLRVDVTAGAGCWSGTIAGKQPKVTGTGDRLRARVLRRARLLKLVEAQPAERYKELQSFIDVGRVEAAEQSLRNALKKTEEATAEAVLVLDDATKSLTTLWESEGSPAPNAISWAQRKGSADQKLLGDRAAQLDSASRALSLVESKKTDLAQKKVVLAECDADLKGVRLRVRALPPVEGMQAVELVTLLQEAKALLAALDTAPSCPVCQQAVVKEDLVTSLDNRLSAMKEHGVLAEKHREAEQKLATAQTNLQSAESSYVKAVQGAALALAAAGEAQHVGATPPPGFAELLKAKNDHRTHLPAALAAQQHFASLAASIAVAHATAQTDLNQFNAIKGHYDRIVANRDRAVSTTKLVTRLRAALKVCEDTRKEYTQGVLDGMQDELNTLYGAIHPNEALVPLRLAMNPSKRGSIDQDATFSGHAEVPPQAYFSESHLDTLGFCVWLVLAKRDRPKDTVLVLDDVFTSVDSVHLTRVIQLLSAVSGDFAQIIVMTHYRTWRDRYRLGQGPGQSVQLLELHRWTLNRGVSLSGTRLAVEQLEAALGAQPLDRQAVASQAGILLEAVLDRLTLQYRRPVPRSRDGDYTLGDLLASCKKLFDVLAVEKPAPASGSSGAAPPAIKTMMQPFFQETGPMTFIRNQVGCHFNPAGSEVADTDIEAFGTATACLARALVCNACGDMADREDGTHFRCGCKQTRMTPLKYS